MRVVHALFETDWPPCPDLDPAMASIREAAAHLRPSHFVHEHRHPDGRRQYRAP